MALRGWKRRVLVATVVMGDLLVLASGCVLAAATGSHPRLAVELIRMELEDQRARQAEIRVGFPMLGQPLEANPPAVQRAARRVDVVDATNQHRLAEIIDEIGWPGRSAVGDAGAHAAWLVADHAPLDFQLRAVELMRRHPHEVRPTDLATIEDRVLVRQGKPQLYGTQYGACRSGTRVMDPVEDPRHLDRRRRAVGLSSVAQNEERMDHLYGPC